MGIQNLTVTTDLYIDGDERPAQHGRSYELYNPARPSELVGHAAAASHEDVDQAVQAGHRAFPAWSALSHRERAEHLRAVAQALSADEEDISNRSRLFTREHGKIIKETLMEMSQDQTLDPRPMRWLCLIL